MNKLTKVPIGDGMAGVGTLYDPEFYYSVINHNAFN